MFFYFPGKTQVNVGAKYWRKIAKLIQWHLNILRILAPKAVASNSWSRALESKSSPGPLKSILSDKPSVNLHCLSPAGMGSVRQALCQRSSDRLLWLKGDGKTQAEGPGTCRARSANTCCYWSGQVWSNNGPEWDRCCFRCFVCCVSRLKGCAWTLFEIVTHYFLQSYTCHEVFAHVSR